MTGKPILTPLDKEIGKIARALREDRGLNQNTIAEALGTSVPQVSYLEGGKRAWSIKNIDDLAKFYQIHPAKFLGGVRLDEGDLDLLEAVKKRLNLQSKIDSLSSQIKNGDKKS